MPKLNSSHMKTTKIYVRDNSVDTLLEVLSKITLKEMNGKL